MAYLIIPFLPFIRMNVNSCGSVLAMESAYITEKKIKIYQKEKDISNSILYNDIYHITGDRNGHVFIMTNRGISVYDIEKDLFSTITRNNMKAQFFSGYLYAATSKQIFKYNGNKLEPFYKFPDNEGYIRKIIYT